MQPLLESGTLKSKLQSVIASSFRTIKPRKLTLLSSIRKGSQNEKKTKTRSAKCRHTRNDMRGESKGISREHSVQPKSNNILWQQLVRPTVQSSPGRGRVNLNFNKRENALRNMPCFARVLVLPRTCQTHDRWSVGKSPHQPPRSTRHTLCQLVSLPVWQSGSLTVTH